MWDDSIESYLRQLSKNCAELSQRYKQIYNALVRRERYFKIPTICISSITGLLSMLNTGMTDTMPINVTASILSLVITITNSVEAYLKVGQNMSASLLTSKEFLQLKEAIDVELSLKVENRTTDGLVFLRDRYNEYLKILEMMPPLLHYQRFVMPEPMIEVVSNGSSDISNRA
jgi:hypothetical protein